MRLPVGVGGVSAGGLFWLAGCFGWQFVSAGGLFRRTIKGDSYGFAPV